MASQAGQPTTPPARLLVADDDVDMVELLRRTLTREGYDVATAAGGEALLAALRRDPPFDVLVSDARMPPADLEQILPAIRAAAPGMKIIAISGFSELEALLRLTREGVFDCVAKPFKIPDLIDAIERALGR